MWKVKNVEISIKGNDGSIPIKLSRVQKNREEVKNIDKINILFI